MNQSVLTSGYETKTLEAQQPKRAIPVGTPITLYITSEFTGHVNKYEGKYMAHGTRQYAQYPNSPFVTMVHKGKRKSITFQRSYKPFMLLLEGHGHPDPGKLFTKTLVDDGSVTMEQATYMSFDSRWKSDFDALINPYLEDKTVIADFRETAGFDVYKRA